jgi:hypothetical protein
MNDEIAEEHAAPESTTNESSRESSKQSGLTIWRNYPLLISVAAFVLSLVTAAISAYASYRRDIHDQQTQLGALTQNLQDLLVKQAQIQNTPLQEQIGQSVAAQYNALLRIAYSRALELGANAPTAELYIVASYLYTYGDSEGTARLLKIAMNNANNWTDELAALTSFAYFEARTPTSAAHQHAEELFTRARALDVKYDLSQFPFVMAFQKTKVELTWANSIAPYDCPGARKHFSDGLQYLRGLAPGTDREQMIRDAKSALNARIGGVQTCSPTETTIPQ